MWSSFLLAPPLPSSLSIFSYPCFFPPTSTSGSAFVRRESIILLHPPTFCPLYLSLCLPLSISVCISLALSLLSSHAPGPSPIFINIVLMIPDGLTCTLWGRSVSGFFQGCAWVVVCVYVCMHDCRVHVCIIVCTYVRDRVYVCACVWVHVFISAFEQERDCLFLSRQ